MIDIAILGYGVVGSGVAEVCRINQDEIRKRCGRGVNIKKILDIREFAGDIYADRITSDPGQIFSDPDISVVVETIGGTGIAYELTCKALESGKHVVTSNKELVARHGPEIMALAREKNLNYLFEASVGGGIPIVRPLYKCLAANRIDCIAGILNGTTNYILTRMARSDCDFASALREAQDKGYAEQNPESDIAGLDARRKIAILGSIVLGEYIDSDKIHTVGIENISRQDMECADRLGCKIKLIGRFRRHDSGRADLIVAPMLLSKEHPLAMADDVFNAIMVEGNALGEAMFYGRGAGKMPTASAVVADVIECLMHLGKLPHIFPWVRNGRDILLAAEERQVKAMVRLKPQADIGACQDFCGSDGISLAQMPDTDGQVLILGPEYNMSEADLSRFIAEFEDQVVSVIRYF